jgi:RNA polymerase sigma-70 factor (ECF subfamily)
VNDVEKSFEDFYRSARPALTGQAWLMTGDLAAAHDLVQETLVRAWKAWDRLQSYDQPEAWARRVLTNLIIGSWRRHRREVRLAEPLLPAGAISTDLDVVAALNSLPPKQRLAIVLHDFVGLKVAEVAAELDAREGTVKSWLSRGRADLAQQLGVHSAPSQTGG